MNGQMTKYERYISSLRTMQEPDIPKAKIDMRGAIEFAKAKGKQVSELSEEERAKFVTLLV